MQNEETIQANPVTDPNVDPKEKQREELLKRRTLLRKNINLLEKKYEAYQQKKNRLNQTISQIRSVHQEFKYDVYGNLLCDDYPFTQQWEKTLVFNVVKSIVDEVNKPIRGILIDVEGLKNECNEHTRNMRKVRSKIEELNEEMSDIRVRLYELEKPDDKNINSIFHEEK